MFPRFAQIFLTLFFLLIICACSTKIDNTDELTSEYFLGNKILHMRIDGQIEEYWYTNESNRSVLSTIEPVQVLHDGISYLFTEEGLLIDGILTGYQGIYIRNKRIYKIGCLY